MAIRFQCSSCAQPIEVDDIWSLKLVACPYCSNTVTAPEASTLADLSLAPTAKPVANYPPNQGYADGFSSTTPDLMKRSRFGVVSVVLASTAFVMMFCFSWICTAHGDQLLEFEHKSQALIKQGANIYEASQRAMNESFQVNDSGTPPTWILLAGLLFMGAGMTWLATIPCALIAIRKPASRKHASIALGICAFTIIVARFF